MNSETNSPVVTVVAGGFHPFPEGYLAQGLQHVVGESARVVVHECKFARNLIESTVRHPWHLCLMFINPYIPWSAEDWSPPHVHAPAILERIKRVSTMPLAVWHNGMSGFTTVDFFSAGADAVFAAPFSFEDFTKILRRLLNVSPAPGGAT